MSGLQSYIDLCVKREMARFRAINVQALAAAIHIAYRSRSMNEITRLVVARLVAEGGTAFQHKTLTETNMAEIAKGHSPVPRPESAVDLRKTGRKPVYRRPSVYPVHQLIRSFREPGVKH